MNKYEFFGRDDVDCQARLLKTRLTDKYYNL